VGGGRIPVHQHGLQAFGVGAFDGRPPGRSFAAEWLDAARSIQEPPAARPGLAPVAGPDWRPAAASARAAEAGAVESIRLAEILGDLASPAQAYCRETLRIRRPMSATTIDEVAPFDPHAIDAVVRERVLAPIWRGDVAVESLHDLVVDAPWAPA